MIRVLCRKTGFTLREIYDLFPHGPAHGACKYAGLPKPDGCVWPRAAPDPLANHPPFDR